MNDRPAISVIVAVYKAESYLQKCLDSLRAQTFKDFEVLLVDDGSPDRSGAICDEYAARDPRFRAFHKENGGVSSARQFGMDHARGEYTIHADPDDWVEPDMLAELYAKARADQADMVICDFYVDRGNHSHRVVQRPSALDHETVLRELFQQLHGSCWNKLVKRACYEKYNVKFPPELSFCEDQFFNAALLRHDIKITYLAEAFYHYIQNGNPNSVGNHYNRSMYDYDVRLQNKFQHLLQGEPCEQFCSDRMGYLIVSRAFFGDIFTSVEFRKKCRPFLLAMWRGTIERRYVSIFMSAACLGFYRPARWLYKKLLLLKSMVSMIKSR